MFQNAIVKMLVGQQRFRVQANLKDFEGVTYKIGKSEPTSHKSSLVTKASTLDFKDSESNCSSDFPKTFYENNKTALPWYYNS